MTNGKRKRKRNTDVQQRETHATQREHKGNQQQTKGEPHNNQTKNACIMSLPNSGSNLAQGVPNPLGPEPVGHGGPDGPDWRNKRVPNTPGEFASSNDCPEAPTSLQKAPTNKNWGTTPPPLTVEGTNIAYKYNPSDRPQT